MLRINRLAAATALAAAFSMVAAPLAAAELPRPAGPASAQAWDENANTAWNRHRWRGNRHDGIDGGDILAGVLILGGIAAIAGAASKADRDDGYRDYPPPPPPRGERYDYRGDYRDGGPQGSNSGSSTGLDRAADICADAVERSIDRVGSIDSVRRGPSGWDVDGTLQNGGPFTCSIGNDGRVRDVHADRSYGGAAYDGQEGGNPDQSYGDPSYDDPSYDDQSYQDGQYDDETYARLRERQGFGG